MKDEGGRMNEDSRAARGEEEEARTELKRTGEDNVKVTERPGSQRMKYGGEIKNCRWSRAHWDGRRRWMRERKVAGEGERQGEGKVEEVKDKE